MKNLAKRTLAGLLAVIMLVSLLTVGVSAVQIVKSGTCGSNLTWKLDSDGTLTISGTGEMTSHPWRAYADQIFSCVIESGVTTIGSSAFYKCTSLISITIPDSVTGIVEHAFYGCSSLTSINIPDGVTSISECAFRECSSLTSINIPDGVTSIGESAFLECSSLTSISIPDSVTSIGAGAFADCGSLTSISIPDGVTSIGESAFLGCSSLTSISIPDSVTSISSGAFADCRSLTSISIPDSVTSIDFNAFSGCSSLTDVYYSGDEESWNKIEIGSDNGYLTNATIHYNSTGPTEDVWQITQPQSLTFEDTSISCNIDGTVNITATCVTTRSLTSSDIAWKLDNRIVSIAGTEIIGPTITGEANTYWISTALTGLASGTAKLTLSVFDRSASVNVTVNRDVRMGIGVLTGVDDNLNYIFIDDDKAYVAEDSDIEKMEELLKNKKISDKRVIYEYTADYNTMVSIYSIYDVLCLQAENVQALPNKLEYSTDSTYQTDTIDITGKLYVALNTSSPYSKYEVEGLGTENLYLNLADITLQAYSTSNIVYFGKTLWMKSTKKEIKTNATSVGYGSNRGISISISADIDDGAAPEDASATVQIAKFLAIVAGETDSIPLSNCSVEVTNQYETQKESELDALAKSYKNAEITVGLSENLRMYYSDGSNNGNDDFATIEYIAKMLTLETISSYNNAENWAERLENLAADKLKDKLLSKLGLSSSVIGGTDTVYVYAQYTGTNNKTIDLKIPVASYTQGGTIYGATGEIYYSTDGKKINDSYKSWNIAGALTYVNMKNFADCVISFVKVAYNQAWGKSADKIAEQLIELPLSDVFKAAKVVNNVSEVLNLNVKLPTSVSDGIFKFTLNQTKKSVSIECPVDVYVYNSLGQVCGVIEDNVISPYFSDEDVALSVDGDKKYVTLYNDDYSILLVGNGSGTMTYQIDEYADGTHIRSVTTTDIPLEEGTVYCGYVPSSLYTSTSIYELITEDQDETIPVTSDESCPSASYTDIDTSKWYHSAVDYVISNSLMTGYGNGKFGPTDTLSRAMLVQTLYNREGKPAVTGTSVYTDVSADKWYTSAVIWGTENGIVNGYGNNKFGPNDNITREQLAVILWRTAGCPTPTQQSLNFTDAGQVSSWALDAMLWANEVGIINGTGDGTVVPKKSATRAETATMLERYIDRGY